MLRDPSIYDEFQRVIVIHSVREIDDLAYDSFLAEQEIFYYPIVTRDKLYPRNKRITKSIYDEDIFNNLGLTPWKCDNDKVMLCGNIEFNKEMSFYLESNGWQQGNQKRAGNYVQEKAFVG